jgi:malonate transporter MadL subunit
LIFLNDKFKKNGVLKPETESGILFWSTMYIPVVVAMSASQNVKAAISGGWVALLAGLLGTAACYVLVPVLYKMTQKNNEKQ